MGEEEGPTLTQWKQIHFFLKGKLNLSCACTSRINVHVKKQHPVQYL